MESFYFSFESAGSNDEAVMAKGFLESILSKLRSATQRESRSLERDELESLKKILDELNHLPEDQALFLAAFAFVLFRVAYADRNVSDEEARAIVAILKNQGELTESQALLVAQIAKSQNILFGGTDNFLVTREFARMATPKQKRHLLTCLFAVAASDESISGLESDTIGMIAKELGLSHEEFIAARSQFRDKLEALK